MLKSYFSKRLKKSLTLLKCYSQQPYAEVLHDFRVSLKRLRFVGAFLKDSGYEKEVRKFNRIARDIFRLAGRTREVDVLKDLLSDRGLDKKYDYIFVELEQLKLLYQLEFQKKAEKNFFLLNDAGIDIKKVLRKLNDDQLSDYFILQFEKTAQLAGTHRTEDFHSLRKVIKILLYGYEAIEGTDFKIFPPKFNQKRFDDLQERIGKWHDLQDLIIFLVKHSGSEKVIAPFIKGYNNSGDEIRKLVLKIFNPAGNRLGK